MDRLRLFVYGSLKQDEFNWHVIRSGVTSCRPARLRGCLYLRHDGYPALVLDSSHRLGSRDWQADLEAAWQEPRYPISPFAEDWIEGQLLLLSPGAHWLERLDEFEGYFPGGESEYVRVLTPLDSAGLAWTYTAAQPPPPEWPRIYGWSRDVAGPLSPYQHGLGS